MKALPLIGLVSAEFLSLLGNQITFMAIPILVLEYTGSPLITGIASAGNVLPIAVAAIFGGHFIDRFGAWRMSLLADLLSMLSVLALPLALVYVVGLPPGAIFLLVLLGALFDPTGVAAKQTLVPHLARAAGKSLEKVNSLRGALENGADFLGPIVAGVLISLVGIVNVFFFTSGAFLLCAVVFAAFVPAIAQLRVRSDDHAAVASGSAAMATPETSPVSKSHGGSLTGLAFIFNNPDLRSVAIIGILVNLAMMPFLGLLLPLLAVQEFENTVLLGLWLSAFGLAATLGAIAFPWLARTLPRSTIFYGGFLLAGICFLLIPLTSIAHQVVVLVFLGGLLMGAGNPLEQCVLQEQAPPTSAGQIYTALAAIRFSGGPAGLLLAGIAAELLPLNTVLAMDGALLIATAIIGWQWLPLLGRCGRSEKG